MLTVTQRRRAAVLVCLTGTSALAVLTGCSALGITSDKVDYKTVSSQKPLDIPPEFTPLAANDRYLVPSTATASSTAAAVNPASMTAGTPLVAPAANNARIERAGGQRWLAVEVPPEQAFPVVKEFLGTVGLAIEREEPALGIVETVWAENRAKLPQDIIRRTIGRALDAVYSTGEQDKYRVRIERTDKNTSEIYISHRGMVEVYTSQAQDQTRWQPRPNDPELEAELLQRLLLRFAPNLLPTNTASASADKQASLPPVISSPPDANTSPVKQTVRLVPGNEGQPARVEIDEPFDRAWRRVGLGLDRGGFTVEDRDRANGLYFVRYLDPDFEAKQREQQGFFSRLFGSEPKIVAPQFRVQVVGAGNTTTISVLNKEGQPERSATGDKILTLLTQQLR